MNHTALPAPNEASLSELIDIPMFQNLCDSFCRLTRLPTAIIDIKGKVLIASGWQRICSAYHRKNPASAAKCLESDTILASRLDAEQRFNIYQCKNGLIDAATPIIIDHQHLGNLFAGQVLFEAPDIGLFTKQAEQFGFDTKGYLAALADIPIMSKEELTSYMNYLVDLTVIIARAGIDRKKLMALNLNLKQEVKRQTKDLESAKIFSESLIRSLPGIMYVLDRSGRFINWNRNLEAISGYPEQQILDMNAFELISDPDRHRVKEAIRQVFNTGETTVEAALKTVSGKVIPYLLTGFKFRQKEADYLIGVGLDISQRLASENEKARLIETLQNTLADVKQLSGLLPICASCKKIRDDKGYWNQLESYIHQHSQAKFSHGLCPDCMDKLYGHQHWYKQMKKKI